MFVIQNRKQKLIFIGFTLIQYACFEVNGETDDQRRFKLSNPFRRPAVIPPNLLQPHDNFGEQSGELDGNVFPQGSPPLFITKRPKKTDFCRLCGPRCEDSCILGLIDKYQECCYSTSLLHLKRGPKPRRTRVRENQDW